MGLLEGITTYFNHFAQLNNLMALNKDTQELVQNIADQYHWYPPFTPEFNADSLSREELVERFPQATSTESARFGAEIVDRIKSRPHDQSFQESVREIVDDLGDEEIRMLPRGLRQDMLIGLNEADDEAGFAARNKLITGGANEAEDAFRLPPDYVT